MKKFKLTFVAVLFVLFLVVPIISVFGTEEDSWETLADVPTGRLGAGVAAVNGKIYVIGGYSQGPLNNNEEYDVNTDTWAIKKRMPTRSNFAIAVYQNKIYCIGGMVESITEPVTGLNEVYDPLTDAWETKAQMPTPREFMDANVIDGKIYVIGGSKPFNPNEPSYVPNINEVYDPETNTWSNAIPPPVQVSNYASAVFDNKIYIFTEHLTQIFDPQTNSWSNGTSMPNHGWGAAAGATTGNFAPKRIYVLGGNPTFNYNQIYDPETDTWTLGASMPTNRYGLGVAVINDAIYAIGGPGANAMVANERYTPTGYIPEFSSWTILLIFLVTILCALVIKKRLFHQRTLST